MIKKYVLSFTAIAATGIASTIFLNDTKLHSNSTGAPGPGSCVASGCHSGSIQSDASMKIEIKKNGTAVSNYVPGETYDVTIGMNKTGIDRFGFAFSSSKGTIATNSGDNDVQVFGYATHTSNGTFPATPGVATWSCKWTAPSTASGTASFQLYINATNNDGNNTGDQIFSTSAALTPGLAGIADIIDTKQLAVYPNPVKDQLNIRYRLSQKTNLLITLVAINGQEMETLFSGEAAPGMQEASFPLQNNYAKGTYLLCLRTGQEVKYQKIFIQ